MTVRIFLLCFTAALLLIHTSNAQGIAGQIPPVYSVPKYINQGLNAYRQTQQIAQVANGLGLPVPQTQKIVSNVAVPLIPPALKLATNVGQPLVPQAQRFGANVGQPLLPKVFPGGLPVLPQLPPTFAAGTLHSRRPLPASTLLLNANPLLARISPLQIRSTGEETKTEKEQTDTAEEANTEKEQADTAGKVNTEKEQTNADINPINELSDDESKEVVGSSGSLYNETTTDEIHQTKTRSPDNKGDDLDYLSKAANPIDDIGSFIKKVGHGLKHSMDKIDTTLWPSHAKPEVKEAGPIDTIPFNEWANYPENRNLTYEKLLLKYIKEVNASRNPDNPLPIELSYLPPRQPNPQMKQVVRVDSIPFSEWATYPENRDLTYQQLMIKYIKEVNASRNPEYQLPIELAFLPPTRPNHRMKQAGRIDTIPFSEWATYPENRDLTYQQLMIKYIKEVNASRNPEYRLPIELAFLPPTRPNQQKQAGRIDTIPFSEWATYPENRDLTYQQLMIKYIKEVNASRNPEYRLPIELAFLPPTRPNQQKQAGRIDTIPFSEWATYPENRDLTYQQLMIKYIKEVNASRNPEYQLPIELAFLPPTRPNHRMMQAKAEGAEGGPFDIVPFRPWADYPENRNLTHSELIEKYKNENSTPGFRVLDQLPTFGRNMIDQFHKSMSKSSLLQNTEQNSFNNFQNKETNPMDKLLNSAAKLADSFIDAMSGSGKNRNEPSDSGQRSNPINTYWEKASGSASQMADSEYPEKATGSTDQMIKNKEWQKMIDLTGQITDSNKDKDLASNQKNNPLTYGAAEMTGKDAQFGIHPTQYYNQQMFHPFSSPAFGGAWNQPGYAGPILNPATNLAHSIRGFNNGEEYYKSSNPSEILSNPMTQYTAMYPVLSRTYRQMAPPLSHTGPGNIWNSATGLADSITNIATNPGKINTGQILGSTGTIFNAAKDLAGDIGKVSTNPGSFANNPHGTFKQSDSLLNPVNPIGTIMNSASNLGSQITNMASNPASLVNSQLLGSARTLGSVSNQAVDVAGKIVNAALNPGINGNGQILQSSSPTYAGGFFPRNNPSGSIVNSATQLASQILNTAATNSGNIGKIPMLKSTSANGNYSPPLGSLFNSASKLAGDITSVATGKL